MTPERLHELEHCIEQIADPVIAGWMGELWDALQAAEARIAELSATVEVYRQWTEEARSFVSALLHLRDYEERKKETDAFLTRPLPGEEDR